MTSHTPFEHNHIEFNYVLKMFDELSIHELYSLSKIRQEIFVVEQNCVFTDSDGYDIHAAHLIMYDQDRQIAAYARILPKEIIYDKATIGRVLTSSKYRHIGLGYVVFKLAIEALYQCFGQQAIKIQAQSYLLKFYERFGFSSISDPYLDTGILHNDLIKE